MSGQADRNALEAAQAFQRTAAAGLAAALAAGVTPLSMTQVAQSTRRVKDLATLLPVTAFAAVVCDGYAVSGDGFGGLYFWNATDARAADGVRVVQVASLPGRWNLETGQTSGSVALVLGSATVSAIITASSVVFLTRTLAGGTLGNTVQYSAPTALMVVGTPGTFTIKALGSDGATVNTLDTSTLGYLVVG